MVNKLTSQTIYVAITRGIGALFLYLFLILAAKFLGKEGFGLYDVIYNIVLLLGTISLLGGNRVMLKFAGKFKAKDRISELNSVYIKVLFLLLIVSIILGSFCFFFADLIANEWFEKPSLRFYVKYSWIVFTSYALFHLNIDTLRAYNHLKLSEFLRNIPRPLICIAVLVFVYNYYPTFGQIEFVILLVSFGVLAVLSQCLILSVFFGVSYTSSEVRYTELVKTGNSLMLAMLSLIILGMIDRFMIVRYMSIADNGLYAAAFRIIIPISFILSAVNQVIAPKISEFFFSNQKEDLISLLNKSMRIIFFSSIPIIVFIFIFGFAFLRFFGEEFAVAKTTLYILLIGQIVNVICGPIGNYLSMTGLHYVYRNLLWFSLILNILLNYFLIPRYGINGAAIATVVSLVSWNILGVLYVYKKHRISVFYNFK